MEKVVLWEGAYNFLLYVNLFVMTGVCLSFPKKLKTPSYYHEFRAGIIASSTLIFFAVSFVIFMGIVDGFYGVTQPKIYITPREHWLPLFLLNFIITIYGFYQFCVSTKLIQTRKSIVYFLQKYPSPDLTRKKLEKFCKDYGFGVFPIVFFLEHLEKTEGNNVGEAFEKMENDMKKYKAYQRLMNKANDRVRNFNYYKNHGVFSSQ